MEALLGRVAKLGFGVAGAAFVGNNFLFNGACVRACLSAQQCVGRGSADDRIYPFYSGGWLPRGGL